MRASDEAAAFGRHQYLRVGRNMIMSLDRFSRRFLDYEELMQQEHPIYKVRRYMATALYAEEQSGDRLLLDHVAWSSALIGRLFWPQDGPKLG